MRTRGDQKKSEKDHLPDMLQQAGLRPTRQRLLLARILFDGIHKHVTAEQVMAAARRRKGQVSLATVYNNLNQFTQAGLLREVSVNQACSYFDTNCAPHHHFFDEVTGHLWDIPEEDFRTVSLPKAPVGRCITGIDITIRLGEAS